MFSLVYESTKHLILEFCSCRFRALQCWLKGFKTLTCMLLVPMIVACACCICHARLLQLRCASYNQPSIATSGVPCTVCSLTGAYKNIRVAHWVACGCTSVPRHPSTDSFVHEHFGLFSDHLRKKFIVF